MVKIYQNKSPTVNFKMFIITKGSKFRELWGDYAGWAQTVLFVDDLKEFSKDDSTLETKKPKKKVKRLNVSS